MSIEKQKNNEYLSNFVENRQFWVWYYVKIKQNEPSLFLYGL